MGSVVPEHSSPESQRSFGAKNSPFTWSGVSLTLRSRSCTISCFGKPGSSAENRRKSGGLVGKPQVLHHPHFCITQGFAVRVSWVALVLGAEQDSPTSRPKPRWPAELPEARVGVVCQLKRGIQLKFCPEWKNCFQTDPRAQRPAREHSREHVEAYRKPLKAPTERGAPGRCCRHKKLKEV